MNVREIMGFLLNAECAEPQFQMFINFCVFASFFNSFDILIAVDEFFNSFQTQQWFLIHSVHTLQMLLYVFSEQFFVSCKDNIGNERMLCGKQWSADSL